MTKENAIIAVYDTHTQAEDTIKELERSSFDMKKLSILGKATTPKNIPRASTPPATE